MKPRKLLAYLSLTFAAAVGGDIALRQVFQKRTPLHPVDIEAAQPFFGDKMDYTKAGYVAGRFSFLQHPNSVLTIGNSYYVPEGASVFGDIHMHELMHIYENQVGGAKTGIKGAIRLWAEFPDYRESYAFTADSTKALSDYNMEQRAEIVQRCFQLRDSLRYYADKTPARVQDWRKELPVLEKIIQKTLPLVPDSLCHYPARQRFLDSLGYGTP